jgi:hypothetical protein
MTFSQTDLNLFWENLIFLVLVTSFLVFVGWVWRESKPFKLPQPLPTWFKAWLSVVLAVGVVVPLIALVLWGVWWGHTSVANSDRSLLSHAGLSNLIRKRDYKSVSLLCVGDDSLFIPALPRLAVAHWTNGFER